MIRRIVFDTGLVALCRLPRLPIRAATTPMNCAARATAPTALAAPARR